MDTPTTEAKVHKGLYDAIIVGGGHNGLVCAAYLARAGLDVLLLERRHILGGACVTEELFPGYRFSACAYYCGLLQTQVIEDLELRRHGFHVYHLDPQKSHLFPDDRRLSVWDSVGRTQDAIGEFSKHDAKAYPKWMAFWERAARLIHAYFLTPPPTLEELRSKVRGTPDESLLETLLKTSMKELVTEYFENEAVQGAFVEAQDVGDPAAIGSAWCYAYMKCGALNPPENVGIVRGGMGAITQAMAAAAQAYGATLKTNMIVERVIVEKGRARGVRLADGTEIRSRLVVSNADPKRTFGSLLNEQDLQSDFLDQIKGLKTNAGYLKFHASLSRLPDVSRYFGNGVDYRYLAYMRICPSVEYFEQSWRDAKSGLPSRKPVMYVQIPTVCDPSLAPEGKHTLSVWACYAPVGLKPAAWDKLRDQAAQQLIAALTEYLPDIRDCLVDWQLFTPADMERRVGLTDGNIRHIDIVPDQYLSSRPLADWAQYRTPVKDLYLCGAGTHPGGEVTGAPGHNAAHSILADYSEKNPGGTARTFMSGAR